MKLLEKTALILFSIIMLVLSVVNCLVIFEVIELNSIFEYLEKMLEKETIRNIILGVSIVSILLSIKALFFPSKVHKKQEIKTGVLLENKDGRLLISKDTIENLVNNVVRSFNEVIEVQTKINLDVNNTITVYLTLLVKEEAVIKDLSASIQNKVKESVKRSTDLEVTQININIRNVENIKKDNNSTKIKVENVKINDKQLENV